MPRYETAEDLKAEKEIIDAFCATKNLVAHKLSEVHYHIDFALVNPKGIVRAYAEVKDRNFPFGKDDGAYLSAGKVAFGKMMATYASVPFLFIVRFDDGKIAYANLSPLMLAPPRWLGRIDRGTLGDMEPIHTILWENFKDI